MQHKKLLGNCWISFLCILYLLKYVIKKSMLESQNGPWKTFIQERACLVSFHGYPSSGIVRGFVLFLNFAYGYLKRRSKFATLTGTFSNRIVPIAVILCLQSMNQNKSKPSPYGCHLPMHVTVQALYNTN